jgi:hypothetical protein
LFRNQLKKFVAKNFCSKRCENRQRSNDFRLPTTILSTKVKPDIPFVKISGGTKFEKDETFRIEDFESDLFSLKTKQTDKRSDKNQRNAYHKTSVVFIKAFQNSHMEEKKKCCVV